MKKQLSILLVMVMILTMTACVARPSAETTEPTIIATVEPIRADKLTFDKEDYKDKIDIVHNYMYKEMTSEEVIDYISDMVHISETETLSLQDMQDMDWSIYHIWNYNDFVDEKQDEFNDLFSKLFDNIYDQAIEQSIPLDRLSGWLVVPDADVMCKYFGSTNFCEAEYVSCPGFWELSNEDKVRVAEAFFANPIFAINTYAVHNIILNSPNEAVTEMAIEHFVALSNSTDARLAQARHTDRVYTHSILCGVDVISEDKLIEIAKNILKNPAYNFTLKYEYFLENPVDETFFNIAFDSLIELAQNADEETSQQIKALMECIEDEELVAMVLNALENN